MLNYLLQPVTYSWLSFPPRCSTFSESTSLPSSSALSVHTHSLQFLAAPLEHEIMPLAFIGGRRPVGVFVAVPARDLFFQCRSASPVPTGLALGALACRLFLVSSRPSARDISPHPWKPGEGRQKSVWAENEGKEFGDLVSQRDDLGKCVCLVSGWLGFAFRVVYIYIYFFYICT